MNLAARAPDSSRIASLHAWGVVALVAVPGSATAKAALIVGYFLWNLMRTRVRVPNVLIAATILGFIGIFMALARAHGVDSADSKDQAARIGIFFMVLACAQYAQRSFGTAAQMDRLCRRTAFTAASFKVLIVSAVVFLDIPFQTIQDAIGFESVTQPIGFDILRLQFPSDFIITFLVACYLGGRSRSADAMFSTAVLIVVMLSFSRFIFLCFLVGLAVRFVWLGRLDFMPKLVLALAVALSLLFVESLVERFTGESSEASDDIRVEQAAVLEEQIAIHPMIGHGMGASVPGFYRSESQRYSYEMQWYATVMQFGIIGTAAFAIGVVAIVLRRARSGRALLCVSILMLMWAASGFTNPFLTSLGTAVGLVMLGWRARIARPVEALASHRQIRARRPSATA